MWKIYVILALCTQTLNAQQDVHTTNRSGRESKNAFTERTDLYSEHINYNAQLNDRNINTNVHRASSTPSDTYNNNSTDPFEYSRAWLESIYKPKQKESTAIGNNASTKSPIFVGNSRNTPPSTMCEPPSRISFDSKLFDIMSDKAQYDNLVYSPIAMQTILAFILTISDGKLLDELAESLVISKNRTFVAKTFQNILKMIALYKPPTTLIMANKLYYDYSFGAIDLSLRNFAKQTFNSEMEEINFQAAEKAAKIINSWVSESTRHLITDIVTPSTIGGATSALLLNSIYFKSEWSIKFDTRSTETQDFFMTKQTKVPAEMMYSEDVYRYGDFHHDLQASVLELLFQTPNISMLLILPHDIEGLATLERKLWHCDFNSLAAQLKREVMTVRLPRFKIEYEFDMIEPLQAMGLNTLFNNDGGLKLFKNQQKPLKIDQFKHKSFINVNEGGVEAAATLALKYVSLSIPIEIKNFVADHPFMFVIRDFNTTYFIGHVVKF